MSFGEETYELIDADDEFDIHEWARVCDTGVLSDYERAVYRLLRYWAEEHETITYRELRTMLDSKYARQHLDSKGHISKTAFHNALRSLERKGLVALED